jgi:hypothetical protein
MITTGDIQRRREELKRLGMAGVSRPDLELGPELLLWRKFRDGEETWEVLPKMIAEWTLSAIPAQEPNVARACLYIMVRVEHDYYIR